MMFPTHMETYEKHKDLNRAIDVIGDMYVYLHACHNTHVYILYVVFHVFEYIYIHIYTYMYYM